MAQNTKSFVPECYIDTNLAEYLLGVKGVNHQHSCNEVARAMNNGRLKDAFAVGMIDHDKRMPTYFKDNFKEVGKSEEFALLKHKSKQQYVIVTGKKEFDAMDQFILDCANDAGVDLSEYGLPSELDGFKKVTKQVTSNNDSRFKRLFAALKETEGMSRLRKILHYLNDNGYKADLQTLKSFFN